MLFQYEAMTHKSGPSILIGEALISKANNKRAGRWKRKKGKGKTIAATAHAPSTPITPVRIGKGKVKAPGSQGSKANDVYIHCQGKSH
ncbi:UNVERIFIED_CONTAM: hypothetical protein Sradi_4911900 [Sesamum radiatum]|uniref:Ribosomal protein L2 n=1 Tax=Sesamum radiatum TaxID=300843 RepID=A0AAW2MCL1_SESRA